jgi:hypothetical protein
MVMVDRRFVCADCGTLAPAVNDEDASTLISMQYGWRITRRARPGEEPVVEARCAVCWAKRRGSVGTSGSTLGSRGGGAA